MNNDVERVKERNNIVEIVGEYVKLTKAGSHYKGLCPFHNEKTPSFTVQEERQMYHCFGCNKGGDVLNFVMEMDSLDFREALTMLAERAGVELTNTGGNPAARDHKERLFAMMEDAVKFYEKQLWDGVGKGPALTYLRKRGVSDDTYKNFRLGFAPDGWRNLHDFLQTRKYTREEMLGGGLIINKEGTDKFYDRFRNRIMFPITDHFGKPIGFTARAMPGDDDAQAKYINTPETALYHKSSVLYGINFAKRAIKDANTALIVEGNMDVIAAHDAGIAQTIAVSGTALTEDHLRVLRRHTQHVTLFFDNDAAGQAALIKSAHMCFAQEFQVAVVVATAGKDAADMVAADAEQFRQTIADAPEAMAYFLTHAEDGYAQKSPEEKNSVIDGVLAHVASLKNTIVRDEWMREIATRLHVDETTLQDAFAKKMQEEQRFAPRAVTQQNTEHTATTAPQERTRAELIERKMVGVMMAFAHTQKDVYAHKESLQSLVQTLSLKTFFAQATQPDLSSLLEKELPEHAFVAVRAQAHEAQMLHGEKEEEERAAIIQEYIAQFMREAQQTHATQIAQDIRSAEAAGDTAKLHELMTALVQLRAQDTPHEKKE